MRSSWIRWVLMLLATSTPLAAQDTSRVALLFGLHGPGVLVFASSKIALRLDGSVAESSTSDVDVWSEAVGVSGLFYLRSWDALRSYVGPRVSLAHTSVSGTSANTWSGQLFFGTEYALGRHFGAFGELGLSYSRTSSTRVTVANQIIPAPSTTSWSTTSGVGLLFRF